MSDRLALETEGLCAAFGRRRVLHDLALHVEEGRIYGFLGRNGAGKSTTIRLILRLLRPAAGRIRIFGRDLEESHRSCLRQIGAMVEAPGLYDHLTGYDNLRVAQILRDLPESSIGEALELTGLARDARRPVRQYSLGMKQRLGLAWALLGRPRLLILDEPINGLDPAGVREVRELVRRLRDERGVTIFLSSHILSEVQQLADRIGVIHEGRLLTEEDCGQEGAERLRVRIRCPREEQVAQVLARLDWVRGVSIAGPAQIQADLARPRAAELNALLNKVGLPVEEFAWTQPTLEDYFLSLTGGGNGDA